MNPFGRGLPPTGLRGLRKGGVGPGRPQTAPQADPDATRPPRSQGLSPLRHRGDPGFPGSSPKPPPRGPSVDNALARTSPRAHRVRSRPHRRLRFLTRRRHRARRGHANEPTVSAAPRRAGAGRRRALMHRRRQPPPNPFAQAHCPVFRADTPEVKNFAAWSGGNGNRPKKETKTSPPHTCWLPRLYLHSRSPLVTPGAVHRAEGGRGEAAPKRLRTYGGRKGPEAPQPLTAANLTVSPRGRGDRVRSGGRRSPSCARQGVDAAASD